MCAGKTDRLWAIRNDKTKGKTKGQNTKNGAIRKRDNKNQKIIIKRPDSEQLELTKSKAKPKEQIPKLEEPKAKGKPKMISK